MSKIMFLLVCGLASGSLVFASPARPTGGALGVQLVPSPNFESILTAGSAQVGQPIPMELHFTWASGANDAPLVRVQVVVDGVDSTLVANKLPASQNVNLGAEFANPTTYEIPYANYSAGQRVTVPFTWTAQGRYGASAQVLVILTSPSTGKLIGRAAYTVGVLGETRKLKPMGSLEIFKSQLDALKANPKATGALLGSAAGDTAAFIPENHRKELDELDARGSDYNRGLAQ